MKNRATYLAKSNANFHIFQARSLCCQPIKQFEALYSTNDLNSIKESLQFHANALKSNTNLRSFLTKDAETLKITDNFIKRNPWLRDLSILSPPNDGDARASLEVLISHIDSAPMAYRESYKKFKENAETSFVAIGGPAAEAAAVVKMLTANDPWQVFFFSLLYGKSNAAWSAKQLHNRHGTALNAASNLTGHALLPLILKRNIKKYLANDSETILEEVLQPDYIKIDMDITKLSMHDLVLYLANEIHWAKNRFRKLWGQKTYYDEDRLLSVLSQHIYRDIEEQSGRRVTNLCLATDPISIHVATMQKELEHVLYENEELKQGSNIESSALSAEEMRFFFGANSKNIVGAWKYHGDANELFSTHQQNMEHIHSKGGKWEENKQLTKIFVDSNQSETKIAGIEYRDTKNKQTFFKPTSSAFVTLGYTAKFKYEKKSEANFFKTTIEKIKEHLNVQQPIPYLGIATGCSIVALFKMNTHVKSLLKKFNTLPPLAVTNSHWTLMVADDDYLMMRMTGGGNMGEEAYSPAYFINILANTRRLYGNALVGIVSVNGCARTLNPENSCRFNKICEGLIISYGKGGTGITKSYIEAVIALRELGYTKELDSILPKHMETLRQHNLDELIRDQTSVTRNQLGVSNG